MDDDLSMRAVGDQSAGLLHILVEKQWIESHLFGKLGST